jgi:hypothetical protein
MKIYQYGLPTHTDTTQSFACPPYSILLSGFVSDGIFVDYSVKCFLTHGVYEPSAGATRMMKMDERRNGVGLKILRKKNRLDYK